MPQLLFASSASLSHCTALYHKLNHILEVHFGYLHSEALQCMVSIVCASDCGKKLG